MGIRLLPAHQIVCKQIYLEIASAVARDLGENEDFTPFHLGNSLAHISRTHYITLERVQYALSFFANTFKRPNLDNLFSNCSVFPSLVSVLRNRGFLTYNTPGLPTPNKAKAPITAHSSRRYPDSLAIGPRIGLSYGTPWHMLAVLHLGCLTYLTKPISITIYKPSDELVASKGLIDIFRRFPFVTIVDADDHLFTWQELDILYDSECHINMYDDSLYSLAELYDISSDRSHDLATTNYQKPHPLTILAARAVQNRLAPKSEISPSSRFENLYRTERKIIALSNRDPVWAGPGQPWRDTPIKSFVPLIEDLICRGYFVVRINTVGEPASFSSPHFLDLTTMYADAQDQLNIYKLASIVIGGVSGVADWPRSFSLLPTLYLNSPVLSVSNGFVTGISMVSTQNLEVINEVLFLHTPLPLLIEALFNAMWTPELLASVGLKAHLRSPSEYVGESTIFFQSLNYDNVCLTTHDILNSLQIDYNPTLMPQVLTNSSFSMLYDIFAFHISGATNRSCITIS